MSQVNGVSRISPAAQTGERESANGPKDIVRCGPGNDTARINTFDRAAKSCEHLRGAGA